MDLMVDVHSLYSMRWSPIVIKRFTCLTNECKLLFIFLTIKAPLLLIGLSFLLGILLTFHYWMALIPLTLLLFAVPKKWFPLLLTIFFLPLPWLQHHYLFPIKPVEGKGWIEISHLSKSQGKGWICRGLLREFYHQEELVAKNIPLSFFMSTPPPSQREWAVKGYLHIEHFPNAQLRKPSILATKGKKHNELREKGKRFFSCIIESFYPDPLVSAYFKALFLGVKENRMLHFYLGRCGLSHLAAISGFHFALLAFFLYYSMGVFLKPRQRALFLITALTLYYLLIGNAPSIQRAWIFSLLTLGGTLINKEIHFLNVLGGALLITLITNPLCALSSSFQLTFAATSSLFLYLPIIYENIKKLIPIKRGDFIITQLSLQLAINSLILPVVLFKFHHFPLSGLVLNLLFPTLGAASLFLLLLGICLTPFGPLCTLTHYINFTFTKGYLEILEVVPWTLYELNMTDFSSFTMTLYVTIWATIGLYFATKKEIRKVELWSQ